MKMKHLEIQLELRLPQFRTIQIGRTINTERTFKITLMSATISHIWLPNFVPILEEYGLTDIVCDSTFYSTKHKEGRLIEIVLSIELHFNLKEGVSLII